MSFPKLSLAMLTALVALVAGPVAGASARQTPRHLSLPPAVVVKAFVDGSPKQLPIAGGRVTVSDGRMLLGRGRTGRRGVAHVWLRSRPGHLLVTVRGGSTGGRRLRGAWSAEVRGRGMLVHVNPVTTLVARYRLAHPRTSLSAAARRVKRYLGLPASYDVATGPLADGLFDGRRLLADIRRSGDRVLGSQLVAIAHHPRARTRRYRGAVPLRHVTHTLDARALGGRRPAHRRRGARRVRGRASAMTASAAASSGAPLAHSTDGASGSGWASTTATVTSSTGEIIDNLGRLAEGLEWLSPFGEASAVAGGVLTIVSLFTDDDQSGPSLTSISDELQALQSSLNGLQTTVSQVRGQLQSVEQATLSAGETGIVASTYLQASAINTDMSYLAAAIDLQLQIGCGDYTASGTPVGPTTCANPVPVQQACPANTLLSYDGLRGRVVMPPGFPTQAQTKRLSGLAAACVGWSDAMYGPGSFVSQVSGNSATGGTPQAGVGWSSMGALADAIVGADGTPGIVQYASMLGEQSSPFYDNASSNAVQAIAGYYQVLYAELGTILPVYAAAIGASRASIATGLSAQPTLAQVAAKIPLPLPAGTVVDTRTGTMWSTLVGANLNCGLLVTWDQNIGSPCPDATATMQAGTVLTSTPSTLTPTSIVPQPGSGLPSVTATSGAAPTLNVDAQAVKDPADATPIDPRTVDPTNGNGRPFADWYAAGLSQLQGLYAGSPNLAPDPPSGMTDGDWLQRSPASGAQPGAGLSQALFGAIDPNWGSTPGKGITLPLETIPNYPDAISQGYDSPQLTVTRPQTCGLAGNTSCATPSFSAPLSTTDISNPWWGATTGWAFDLNNGSVNGGLGPLQNAASNSVNWQNGVTACLGTNFVLFGSDTCANTQFYESVATTLNGGGFPTLFYRQPAKGECYVYLPPGVQNATSGNGTVCKSGS